MRISCANLKKDYSQLHAVNGVSISAEENRITCIVGRSGAGKSTLIRLLSLLEKADSGEVLYDGSRVDNLRQKEILSMRRSMGMIFQSFNLFSSRNVLKNVLYPLEVAKVAKHEAVRTAYSLLEMVGLADKAHDSISSLSGGQKQRVAIARSLVLSPKVLFCDEATSALDPQSTKDILQLIKSIQRELNLTVVMVTHQMEVVKSVCDYLVVMEDGRVIEEGEAQEHFANPRSDTLAMFLRDMMVGSDDEIKADYYLQFLGDVTEKPILSILSRKYNLDFNIKAGGTRNGGSKTMELGGLYGDIAGNEEDKRAAMKELREMSVKAVELTGKEGVR